MAKYRIYFTQTASASAEVEADTYDEAVDLAWDEIPSDVCAQCSGWGRDYSFELGGDWNLDQSQHEKNGEYIEGEAAS